MPSPKYVNLQPSRSLIDVWTVFGNLIKWDNLKRTDTSSDYSAPVTSSNYARLSQLSQHLDFPALYIVYIVRSQVSSLYPKSPRVRREGWRDAIKSHALAYKVDVDAYAFASRGWMACVLYIRDTVLAGRSANGPSEPQGLACFHAAVMNRPP